MLVRSEKYIFLSTALYYLMGLSLQMIWLLCDLYCMERSEPEQGPRPGVLIS